MKAIKTLRALGAALALVAAGSAQAAACNPAIANRGLLPSTDDLGATVLACAGFFEGNLNNDGGAADGLLAVQDFLGDAAWAGYGLSSSGRLEQFNLPNGTSLVNFATDLSGLVLVGVHYGNYGGGSTGARNVTTFYLVDAGTSLDSFAVNVSGGVSNAAIWAMAPVPEPGTYALLAAGLAGIGFVARRRGAR